MVNMMQMQLIEHEMNDFDQFITVIAIYVEMFLLYCHCAELAAISISWKCSIK